jgi:hypothetical protein
MEKSVAKIARNRCNWEFATQTFGIGRDGWLAAWKGWDFS